MPPAEYRRVIANLGERVADFGDQHHGGYVAGVPTRFTADGYDDIDAGCDLAHRMISCPDQRRDGNIVLLPHVQHHLWRNTQSVSDQPDRMAECELQYCFCGATTQIVGKGDLLAADRFDVPGDPSGIDAMAL